LDITSEDIDLIIKVKDFAVKLLSQFSQRFEIKYPSFKSHLINLIEELIVPNKNKLLTSYGAIKV